MSENVSPELEEAGTQGESYEAPAPDNASERNEETADVSGADESAQRQWDLLPDVCLQHVLSWLGDQGRVRASLVCRRWHSAIRSPALWRHRRFRFSGYTSMTRRTEQELAVAYARSLGCFLEVLEVEVVVPYLRSMTLLRRIQLAICALLRELCSARARLRSLTIRNLELQQDVWVRGPTKALVQSLVRFLRHMASHLVHLSFCGSRASLQDGLKIMEALASTQQHLACIGASSRGIITLDLEGLFSTLLNSHNLLPVACHIPQIHRLECLTLSYNCVSDELLHALGSKVKGQGRNSSGMSLKHLRLKCQTREPHSQVVCGSAWASLAQRCPQLCVEIDIEGITNVDRLQRILLPQVPLTTFIMFECNFSEQDIRCKPIFRDTLPHYCSQLQVLSVEIDNCYESVDRELLELLMLCSQLHTLELNAYLGMSFVEQVLEYCQESRGPLRSFDMKVCYLSEGDSHEEREEEKLEELLTYYKHFIHPELQLSIELFPIK